MTRHSPEAGTEPRRWSLWPAPATLGVRVLTIDDLVQVTGDPATGAAADLARACYKFTIAQKKVLATANLLNGVESIIGMLPMSLGLGEGGEQNAPLGRAVIGGLAAATVATLFFVPVIYAALRKHPPHRAVEPELQEP